MVNANVNQLASADFLHGFTSLIIILAFNFGLTNMGIGINVCLLVATVLKIINACWFLGVNSDKRKIRGCFKLQCLFSQILAGLVVCFSTGVAKMTTDGVMGSNIGQVSKQNVCKMYSVPGLRYI